MALSYVHRLEEFKAKDIEYSGHRRVIRYRDVILPIVSANEQLGYENEPAKDIVHVVVIKRAGRLFGLEVNEILDTMSTTIEVTQSNEEHAGIFGNLNTPSELIVVVNPFDLINKEYPEVIDRENYSPSSNQKLLLVEDTVFFRRMIKSVLEERGYEVVVAQDGQEAWSILNSSHQQFDLVVSDIEMPRMNGLQLALNIRKTPKFEKLPLLAISSRADREYRTKGMSAGFDVYLEKLKPVLLLSAISELTKKRRVVA
jgi:two-component system chemotaxis sensor kinase CheA